MMEKKFRVHDEYENVIASNMTFDILVAFLKGFLYTFFEEKIILKIEEECEEE